MTHEASIIDPATVVGSSLGAPDAGAPPTRAPELVCPAGSLPALKAAIDGGADCVYLGLRDATNARNFAGLNFDDAGIASGIAHDGALLLRDEAGRLQVVHSGEASVRPC